MKRIASGILIVTVALVAQAQTYTWRNVQIYGGGFIVGIVFNQTEPNLVYTRTDIGGAYRLDNATGRWIPLLDSISWDDWNLTGVVSIATDPVNPNNVYVAARRAAERRTRRYHGLSSERRQRCSCRTGRARAWHECES